MASTAPKLSFGLKGKFSQPVTKKPAPAKSAFGFGHEDDEDDGNVLQDPTPGKASTSRAQLATWPGMIPKVSTATLTKSQKAKQAAELELDSTVYEYDEVFDRMKEGSRLAEQEKAKDAEERKPKYISRLMETAELRKRDRLRAEDKMIQREREKEGEEFVDKDAFVTPAYLAQQEELRRAEEDEKKREEMEASKSGGMTSFHKAYLETAAKAHEAAVAASLSKAPPSFTIEPPRDEKTEIQIAKEFAEKTGRQVEVNDEGIIIDKRQLMTGGLNIVAKPTTGRDGKAVVGGFSAPISTRDQGNSSTSISGLGTGLSAAEKGRQSRERHSREVERQMIELEARQKREAEEALEQKVQKVAKRNDETKVDKLKREAEERRLKRAEEAKAAAKVGI